MTLTWLKRRHKTIQQNHGDVSDPMAGDATSTTGFIVYSINGYTLVGPSLPSSDVEQNVFLWKVTCPSGVYVRQGLELTIVHVDTIPFGSFDQCHVP